MIDQKAWTGWVAAGALGVILVACSQQGGQSSASSISQQEERTFPLKPDSSQIKVAFLTGSLQNLRITEEVDRRTGTVVDPPWLHATLKLKNASADQAARLISGRMHFLDSEGHPIPLPKDRSDTSFTFSTYQTDRLDPGMEISQTIEIPFPVAALDGNALRDLQLELTFTPLPYKNEAVTVPISVGG